MHCIGRRDFLTLLGGAAAAPSVFWTRAALAQQPRRVGIVSTAGADDQEMQQYVAAFEQVLRSLGWRPGENLRIDYRWAAGVTPTALEQAAELVALAPDVIVATTTFELATMQQLTKTIPIVFNGVSDPIAQGFVGSLTRPGGNITGFAGYELSIGGKWLDLLKQLSPDLKHVILLGNPVTSPQFKYFLASIEAAGPSFGVEVVGAPVADLAGIESAVAALSGQHGGLIVANDNFLRTRHLADILRLTTRHRVPAIYAQRSFVEAGGLMRYGTVSTEAWRGTAFYVDRILKGAKPADLPVQQPTRYELVVNLKAAKSLGLELPMGLMMRADEVIE
jgi:putative ABC transport system substrate-binding protein